MEWVIFILLVPWLELGFRAAAIPILLVLFLVGMLFYWAATGRTHLCKAMAISLFLATVTLFVAPWPCYILAESLAAGGSRSDLERISGMAMLFGGVASYAAAVLVFAVSFWCQTARRKNPALHLAVAEESEATPSAAAAERSESTVKGLKGRLTPLRVIAWLLLCVCLATATYLSYYAGPARLQTSELLIQRLMYPRTNSFIKGAKLELVRRGPKTVPMIAAALQSIPNKPIYVEGEDAFYPGLPTPTHLFQVLGDIGTEQGLQLVRDWAANRDGATGYRLDAARTLFWWKQDENCLSLIDDLLRDKGSVGTHVRGEIFGKSGSFQVTPKVAEAVMPYFRFTVEEVILAQDEPEQIGVRRYSEMLKGCGTPEAEDLLVRMAKHDEETRKNVEAIVGKDNLADLLSR